MTDERRSGIALIVGSAAMVITMAFHPHGKLNPADIDSALRMLIAVHTLALLSIPVLFLGAWGMTRWVATPDRLAWAALVLFAMGSVAVMNAAVFDGLVAPNLIRPMVAATAETRDGWQSLMNYNFQLNQAFARVYAAGSSLAVVLWSVSIWRSRRMAPGLAIYGIILGTVTALATLSGLLSPTWHGFTVLILGQAIWFIGAGAQLCRAGGLAA
jgi:hypothetical protein